MAKNQTIEMLRIVSAFGIVWFHSTGLYIDYAGAGLVAFAVMSGYFEGGQNISRTKPISALAKQFLIPWLIWFVFFAIINIARRQPLIPLDDGLISGILTGPSYHLWYLPLIFILSVVTNFAKRHMAQNLFFAITLSCCIIMLTTSPVWITIASDIQSPFSQYLHILAPLLAGLVLGLHRTYRMGFAAPASLIFLSLTSIKSPGVGLPYAIGLASVWAASSVNFQKIDIRNVSSCMLGVYLIHPFFILVHYYIGLEIGIVSAAFAFTLSFLTIYTLRLAPEKSMLGSLVRLAT